MFGDDDPEKTANIVDEPVPETLNQMHRYRDAIYYGNRCEYNFSKEVIGAYILFPGRLDEREALRQWIGEEHERLPYYLRSIFEVNVGAFPLLPNEDSGLLLRYHLDQILNHSTPLEQIEHSVPHRGLQYLPAGEDGVLMVMMENWAKRLPQLWGARLAVPVKMTEAGMTIIENVNSIRYVLFHHRASQQKAPQDREQHLFRVLDLPKVVKPEDIDISSDIVPISKAKDARRYVVVNVDLSQEIQEGAMLDCSIENIPFATKEERYDAQYAEMIRLKP